MNARDWREPLEQGHPMAAARIVRRDRYAWPGGYALALVTTGGGAICPQCVADNFAAVSWSHRVSCSDGWRPAGLTGAYENDTETHCDHCDRLIFGGEE